MSDERSRREQTASTVLAATSFVVGMIGAVAFATAYTMGPDAVRGMFTQVIGVSLMIAFAGIGAGLVFWAHGLMPQGPEVEEREFLHERDPRARRSAMLTFEESAEQVGRRRFLGRMLTAALTVTGIAFLFPIRSLGPSPFPQRVRTGWRAGVRLVTVEGRPVRLGEMEQNSFLTVFPEGHIHEALSQTILLRVPQAMIDPIPQLDDAPEGHLAFSKVCTHAGCAIGLYQVEAQRLFCPCHQTAFDVLREAEPVFGPAPRPLPRLPLGVDEEGFLIALDDYPYPVGPGFWTYPSVADPD